MTMTWIAGTTVGSGGTTPIEFSNIPQNFTHLKVIATVRDSIATTDANILFVFNNDSGPNYDYGFLYSNGTNALCGSSHAANFGLGFRNTGSSSSSGIFGVGYLDILDYSNPNKGKMAAGLTGHDQNGSGFIFYWSSQWRSTSPITSIKFTGGANFAQGCTFDLYGITVSERTGV